MVSPGTVEKYIVEKTKNRSILAALIDPEDFAPTYAARVAAKAEASGVSLILVGGSTISDQGRLGAAVKAIKRAVTSHVVLFPGNITGVSRHADAILFSSLLNSTNSYFLIGAQAIGAMEVFKSGIESIPMGYLIFGNGSAASFIGQVNPLPPSRPSLAVIYALAAKYLGMRSLYLEAGSGAEEPIPEATIRLVKKFYDGILIVGGGITTPDAARKVARAGASILVVGNILKTPNYEKKISKIASSIRARP